MQNHAYELAIKEGTHNILKTEYLPSLIPLGGDPKKQQTNKKINHHKVETQSTIKKYLSSMKLIECVPLLIVYDFVHNNFSLANVIFSDSLFFLCFFSYSAGLIILDSNIVSMYFHVFFAKVSCNRYSLNSFMLRVLLNVQLLHRHLQSSFFLCTFSDCHSLQHHGVWKKKKDNTHF